MRQRPLGWCGVLVVALCSACTGDDARSDAVESPQSVPPPGSEFSGPPFSTVPFVVEATLAPPEGLDALAGGLFSAPQVGAPDSWAVLDLDPLVPADLREAPDADPMQGLLTCAPGTIREGDDTAWLSRRFTAPEAPLDDGLLSVELILEIEDDGQFAADVAALAQCTVGEQAIVSTTPTRLELPESAGEAEAVNLSLLSEPTADVPFPSSYAMVTAHREDRTATVIFGGLDQGADWTDAVHEIAGRVLLEITR